MKRIYFPILIALFALSACSLEEEPLSFTSRDRYYQTETQCTAALNGCYAPMASIYTANFMIMTEAVSDLWYSLSTTVDAILDVTPAKPQFGSNVWYHGYRGVMRCNECIECIGRSSLSDEVKKPMVAEARTLRAFYYYILTCVFNGVPYYEYMVENDQTLEKIRRLPRTDASEIRTRLIDDLKTNALPDFNNEQRKRASEIKDQRAGYAMCQMLIAKMAMWNEDWPEAVTALKAIEEIYGPFSEASYPLEQTMWRYKNKAESILEIQHDWSKTGVQYNGNVANIVMPSNTVVDGIRYYDGVRIPELGNEATSWSSLRANNTYGIYRLQGNYSTLPTTQSESSIFSPLPLKADLTSGDYNTTDDRYYMILDEDVIARLKAGQIAQINGRNVDRRCLYVLGLGNYDRCETFDITKRYGVGWAGPKFWCPGIVQNYDSNNYTVFRYADVILMLAECHINMENPDEAMRYLNMTRERAGVEPYDNFVGFEDLTIKLRAERARELGGEFQRKFDLVRWGVWYEQTLANTNQSKGLKDRIRRCHRYYPIPDTECALSGYVLTNDEYVAEGM